MRLKNHESPRQMGIRKGKAEAARLRQLRKQHRRWLEHLKTTPDHQT
ncbi:MAG: hypothetical protein Q6K08_00775 [Thermostichales cyanobacterium GMQP_bins_62]